MAFRNNSHADLVGTPAAESVAAFSVDFEISLKHWDCDSEPLENLRRSELKAFCREVRRIQREGIPQRTKPITGATGLRLVDYRLSGPLYGFRLGGQSRMYVGTKTEEPSRGYLMYIDPSHKIVKTKGKGKG